MKNPMKHIKTVAFVFVGAIVLMIPFFINEAYKIGGYVTKWDADTALVFYGSFLSLAGTVMLGMVTVQLSKQANNMNKQLLLMQEEKNLPYIRIFDRYFQHPENLSPAYLTFSQKGQKKVGRYQKLRVVVQNVSLVDISYISLKSLSIREQTLEDFETKSAGLNKSQIASILLIFRDKQSSMYAGEENEKLVFEFLLSDYLGNQFSQSIEIKVSNLQERHTEFSLNTILEYQTTKSVKLN